MTSKPPVTNPHVSTDDVMREAVSEHGKKIAALTAQMEKAGTMLLDISGSVDDLRRRVEELERLVTVETDD